MENYYKYLPVTQIEKEWGFYVTTIGYTHIYPNEKYPQKGHPKTHSFDWNEGRILNGYYLVFISKGQGVFESALTKERIINEGTCFFLFPDIWHRYKPNLQTGWEEYWVGFNGVFPNTLMQKNFFSSKFPFINTGLNETLLISFHRLLEAVQNSIIGYHQITTGIVLEMLGIVNTISMHKNPLVDPDMQSIHKAKFLLRESLEEQVNMRELTKELPMSYSKFRKLFKLQTGYSPHSYLLKMRIEKAKELLKTTTLNINEIAWQTGFDSEFYFSNIFKKKTGVSPSHYRVNEKLIKHQ